jgi:hypothetical protein
MSLAGRTLYHAWHRPVGWCRALIAEGGPVERRRTQAGRRAMAIAAGQLPPLPPVEGAPLTLHFLTGARFWEQTAFCLWSFARQARRPLAPVIHDDGTLADVHQAVFQRLFPATRFVGSEEIATRLDAALPESRFPVLRERWRAYPHIRKLINPHLGDRGWKLVLDSDLLFFRRPDFLLAWLDHPDRPLHAIDCEEAYGYPTATMGELAGHPITPLVNVGLTGLASDEIDWEQLESWTRTLLERHGTSYYLEQALVAMLVAGCPCAVAPAADYVTNPMPPEAGDCRAVMHHYVAQSKRWYFRHNWRRVLAQPPAA